MSRRLVLVRHGQTEWSLSGQHTSTTDLPLTDEGARLAAELGTRLQAEEFALVLSSPLRRALDTCKLAGLGGTVELEPRLVEWNYGEYEGLTTPQIRALRPNWDLWRDGCPGGEAPAEVGKRVDEVLARVAAVDGDVALFAHGHILRVLAARWVELPTAGGARLRLDAGAISELAYERETRVVQRWNT